MKRSLVQVKPHQLVSSRVFVADSAAVCAGGNLFLKRENEQIRLLELEFECVGLVRQAC